MKIFHKILDGKRKERFLAEIKFMNVKVNIGSSQIFCMEFMCREINDLIFREDAYTIMIMT